MNYSIVRALAVTVGIATCGIVVSTATVAAETEAKTMIPNTSAGIWLAIDGHVKELHAAITQGKLNTVHKHAFAVRDLVRALPSHSAGLSASALATVTTQVKFVDTLAERLDQSGDANDKLGTEDNTRKLEAILKGLHAQYQ